MFLLRRSPAKRSSLNTVQYDVPQDVSFQRIHICCKPSRGYTLLNVGHEYFPLALIATVIYSKRWLHFTQDSKSLSKPTFRINLQSISVMS